MRTILARYLAAAVPVLGSGLFAAGASAAYPDRPVLVVVPLQAGSAADVATRLVLGKVAENMRQTFIIENQAGVSGLMGADRVARATPDGYTLGGITDSVVNYAVNLAQKQTFDPLKDLTPISKMATISWVLVVNDSFPAKSVADLITMAKAQPKGIDFASAGVGSPQHIAMGMFASANAITLSHVPYKGATQATVDVAAGQVPMMFSAVSVVQPFLQNGKLRALAQPNARRATLLPDVPTFAQAGAPPFEFSTWLGLYGPKGLPAPIVERLNTEVRQALADPAVKNRLLELGLEADNSSPEQLGTLTRDGFVRVGNAIRAAGITAE